MSAVVRGAFTARASARASATAIRASAREATSPSLALRAPRGSATLGASPPRARALVVRASEAEDAAEPAAPAAAPEPPAAATPVPAADPDADRKAAMVAEIKQYLKRLYVKREMNFNEVRLTLAIEDPRLADRRERYGIEDESGVSADEKVAALEAIDAGETPDDLLALEMLLADFRDWPGLEDDVAAEARRSAGPSRYAEIANQAAGIRGAVPGQRTGGVEEKEEEEMDGNPFGFLVLYGVSAVPIFITIAALSIMFVNSLQ